MTCATDAVALAWACNARGKGAYATGMQTNHCNYGTIQGLSWKYLVYVPPQATITFLVGGVNNTAEQISAQI